MFKLIPILFLFGCSSDYSGCYKNKNAQYQLNETVIEFVSQDKYLNFKDEKGKKIILKKDFFINNYSKVKCK